MFKFCILVGRIENQNMRSIRKPDALGIIGIAQGHSKMEASIKNKSVDVPLLKENPKAANKKRRNHWLDHLSSFYHPIHPISFTRRYGKRTTKGNY